MVRLAASFAITLLANAIALVIGAQVLTDMSLSAGGFIIAVLLFTGSAMLAEPFFRQLAMRSTPALLGSTALISALVSLIVTASVTEGLQISGATTWVLATILVWVVALVARFLLPLVLFKKTLASARNGGGRLA